MLRVAFAGTPEFARVALAQLLDAGFSVPLVLTRPDRPAGRGQRLLATPVKQHALARRIALLQPRGLRADGPFAQDAAAARTAILAARADVLVVAAYGQILPQWLLDLPPLGALNIHASLLPRWRGAAPIQRVIEAGDGHTGVTIMQMDAGLDTGAMLLAERLQIAASDTAATLHDRLAPLGARLIVQALHALADPASARLQARAQPAEGVTYAHKITKAESSVDWSQPAHIIGRRMRAFDPFPGLSTQCGAAPIKLWGHAPGGQPHSHGERPGTVLCAGPESIALACGQGTVLHLTVLQRAGGKRLAAADFARGFDLRPGMLLGGPPA